MDARNHTVSPPFKDKRHRFAVSRLLPKTVWGPAENTPKLAMAALLRRAESEDMDLGTLSGGQIVRHTTTRYVASARFLPL